MAASIVFPSPSHGPWQGRSPAVRCAAERGHLPVLGRVVPPVGCDPFPCHPGPRAMVPAGVRDDPASPREGAVECCCPRVPEEETSGGRSDSDRVAPGAADFRPIRDVSPDRRRLCPFPVLVREGGD